MLKEQITENVDTSKDPMTVVAQGAALYASTIDIIKTADTPPPPSGAIRLDVKCQATIAETTEAGSVKVSKENVPVPDEPFQNQESNSDNNK
jgi:molecular chaperone DnaK